MSCSPEKYCRTFNSFWGGSGLLTYVVHCSMSANCFWCNKWKGQHIELIATHKKVSIWSDLKPTRSDAGEQTCVQTDDHHGQCLPLCHIRPGFVSSTEYWTLTHLFLSFERVFIKLLHMELLQTLECYTLHTAIRLFKSSLVNLDFCHIIIEIYTTVMCVITKQFPLQDQ